LLLSLLPAFQLNGIRLVVGWCESLCESLSAGIIWMDLSCLDRGTFSDWSWDRGTS